MLLRMKNSLPLFLGAVFLLAGCRKDGGDETPSPFLSIQTISSLKDNKDVSIRPTTHDFWVQEGQLVKIDVLDDEGDGQSYAFLHSANRLTRQSSDGKITDYRLDNEGKCIEVEYPDGSIETIVYNNNRHPVQYGEDVYEWQDGNLIQATCHTDYGVISWDFSYEKEKVNPAGPLYDWYHIFNYFFPADLFVAGIGGQTNRQLVSRAVSSEGDEITWSYTFDSKGRVSTSTLIWNELTEINTYTYHD